MYREGDNFKSTMPRGKNLVTKSDYDTIFRIHIGNCINAI